MAAADAAKRSVSAEELDAAEARARSAAAAAARKEAAIQDLRCRVDQLTWCWPVLQEHYALMSGGIFPAMLQGIAIANILMNSAARHFSALDD